MPAKVDYTGAIKVMNNGQTAQVIEYVNSTNMTIQFEDGTIVYNVRKVHFDNGRVANPNFNPHTDSKVGKTKLMNNGMRAKIIDYIDSRNITVEFEDGTIVYNRRYAHFLDGRISIESNDYSGRKASCEGETRIMNCGLKATCIKYNDNYHIDVQFEDGKVVTNKTKAAFYNGAILHPDINKSYYCNKSDEYMNMRKQMNCGEFCTIIDYINVDNITVKFDDGEIVTNRTMNQFKLGAIDNTKAKLNFRSLPQMLCYLYLKYYFSDAKMNFRPDWLKNNTTGMNFEIDVYIPQIKVALEYDGCNAIHIEKTPSEDKKYNLMYNSDYINKIIVIREYGCIEHKFNDKLREYKVKNQYSYDNYILYLKDILSIIYKMLVDLGIKDSKLNDKVSLSSIINGYDETKKYSYNDIKTNVINLIYRLDTSKK